jgi:hypothetical protein
MGERKRGDRDQFRSSDFSSQPDTWQQLPRTAAPPVLAAADPPPPKAAASPASQTARPNPLACPGQCNRAYHKAWKEYAADAADYDATGLLDSSRSRPGAPEEAFWFGAPVWCAECTSDITLRLAQLDTLAGIIAAYADGHRSSGEPERVSGSQAAPPSPSQAADDLDEMFRMLSAWEEIYRSLKGWLSGPPSGELASRETECVNWLRRHLRGILASEVAADFGREILQWHREGTTSAKAGVRTLRKPMRCPGCKYMTLFWTEGEKNVYCKNDTCGRILSLAEYEAEAERQARILQRVDGEDDDEADREAS